MQWQRAPIRTRKHERHHAYFKKDICLLNGVLNISRGGRHGSTIKICKLQLGKQMGPLSPSSQLNYANGVVIAHLIMNGPSTRVHVLGGPNLSNVHIYTGIIDEP